VVSRGLQVLLGKGFDLPNELRPTSGGLLFTELLGTGGRGAMGKVSYGLRRILVPGRWGRRRDGVVQPELDHRFVMVVIQNDEKKLP
jgi:hypothetical protein